MPRMTPYRRWTRALRRGRLARQSGGMVECLTVAQRAIAWAEIVVEGLILTSRCVAEGQNTRRGKAMPIFPSYTGHANRLRVSG